MVFLPVFLLFQLLFHCHFFIFNTELNLFLHSVFIFFIWWFHFIIMSFLKQCRFLCWIGYLRERLPEDPPMWVWQDIIINSSFRSALSRQKFWCFFLNFSESILIGWKVQCKLFIKKIGNGSGWLILKDLLFYVNGWFSFEVEQFFD